MTKLKLLIGQWLANFTRRLQNNFYLYLAALLTVFVLLDASVFHVGENMRQKAFDFMVRHRVVAPAPDQDIVIIDINEASLAAMAKEYGRWPWPRQVFGEFVENIQTQQPRAIVFDVLFSDADLFNPDSDAYFNEVIAGTDNTYFPFLRLPEAHDKLSQVRPGMIPGLHEAVPGQSDPNATIAVVLPHFDAAVQSGRLGTHNIYPDRDGIVREYRLYRDDYGWRLPSLPMTVGLGLAYPLPDVDKVLLNWRGKPFSYQYATFSDVFQDMASKVKQRPAEEFKDKIVIIGSTAASLGDIKATAMDKTFPGVEILATAIDNVKHDDYLWVLRGSLPYVLISLLLIWLTTLAFYINMDRDKLTKLFSGTQIGLLVLSYIGINLADAYLDFTGPIAWAVMYFSVAKIYALANDRALQRWLAYGVKAGAGTTHAQLMPVIVESREPLGDALLKKLKRKIELASRTPCNVDIIKTAQSGIWGLFGDMVLVSWTYAETEAAYAAQAKQDASQLAAQLSVLVASLGLPTDTLVRHAIHDCTLAGEQTASQWRTLFAQAIIRLEHDETPLNASTTASPA
ncbi:CHASE2 domain-containing protein [Pseudomethylobacillus aquaticus]|uniref:CHASE2 domain-containing protein n=1 Tax=Pseudomethylobacillus aquaticus TaxID=2676064 RepID=A0A3N0V6Z7_9PROT|nr:CHASE2 domain-containing protein [Pseudomethylobacillus aquaticus]ROH88576.1 CHASE2 domain-containing protein [Pseudomethylobacillus aquaticus]